MILELSDYIAMGGMLITFLSPLYILSWKNLNNINILSLRYEILESAHNRIHHEK